MEVGTTLRYLVGSEVYKLGPQIAVKIRQRLTAQAAESERTVKGIAAESDEFSIELLNVGRSTGLARGCV